MIKLGIDVQLDIDKSLNRWSNLKPGKHGASHFLAEWSFIVSQGIKKTVNGIKISSQNASSR